jgi:hypothetical protein
VLWHSALAQRSGSALWLSTLAQRSGSALWLSALAQRSGSALWLSALAQRSGSALWLSALAQHYGSALWLSALAFLPGEQVLRLSGENAKGFSSIFGTLLVSPRIGGIFVGGILRSRTMPPCRSSYLTTASISL